MIRCCGSIAWSIQSVANYRMGFVFGGQVKVSEVKTVSITVITHTRFFVRDPEKRIIKASNVVFQEMSTLRVQLQCCELGQSKLKLELIRIQLFRDLDGRRLHD